jgi:hypothetical protein
VRPLDLDLLDAGLAQPLGQEAGQLAIRGRSGWPGPELDLGFEVLERPLLVEGRRALSVLVPAPASRDADGGDCDRDETASRLFVPRHGR